MKSVVTIEEMNKLISREDKYKLSALLGKYKSIEFFPISQRDHVVTHFGCKVVKRTNRTYTDNATGKQITQKQALEVVHRVSETNHKLTALLATKSKFNSLSYDQRKLILDYVNISLEEQHIFYFVREEE